MRQTETFIASPHQFNSPQEVADFLENKFSYKGFLLEGISYVLCRGEAGMKNYNKENNNSEKNILKKIVSLP